MTSYVMPIVAGIGGALFLGEKITPFMLAGMGFIVSGVAAINFGSAKRQDPPQTTERKPYPMETTFQP